MTPHSATYDSPYLQIFMILSPLPFSPSHEESYYLPKCPRYLGGTQRDAMYAHTPVVQSHSLACPILTHFSQALGYPI